MKTGARDNIRQMEKHSLFVMHVKAFIYFQAHYLHGFVTMDLTITAAQNIAAA